MRKFFERKSGSLAVALALAACGGQSNQGAASEETASAGGSEVSGAPERVALTNPVSSAEAKSTPTISDVAMSASTESSSPGALPESDVPTEPGSGEDRSIFQAAGFTYVQKRSQWESGACGDPPAGASYEPGAIGKIEDINGDGRPEVIVTEGGAICFGMSGLSFQLLSRQANGQWKVMTGGIGIPEFLATRGTDNFPDIQVGGPGFCFPVIRWNGSEYKLQRHEYEGKPCSR
ncbi:hypothetical protein [Sphingopyxis sp. 113P3]|uniref:hypothetical protein n=1 Tax=Sphingopyxis sp. (strain 113P3) TaxID=292913 RepID=UPI0006BC54A3|nr:hypothetical protein [Sphingopyxis sp. 113P3]ALC11483.1 hypothetical protein LH20_05900 [Sphingopyxis sp. 113P3]